MKIDYVKLSVLNYLYLVLLEFIFKFFVIKVFDIGIIYILIITIPISLIITFIMSLFKHKIINRIISYIIWLIFLFIFVGETVYYSFYKTICGISALSYGGQVMEFFSAILTHIISNKFILIGYIFLFIILIILSIKFISYEKNNLRKFSLLFIPSIFMCLTLLEVKTNNTTQAYNLFFKTNDIIESTNRFGINTGVILDAIKYVSNFEETLDIGNTREFSVDDSKEYNVTNIDFDTLINNETDDTVKSMHAYFMNQSATSKNDYTGIFAGKNLIFITAEGFYPIAVDEKYTPTLYKLVNNSFVFENYYQPIYNCSTSDGEFVNLLSILPGVSTCSMKSTTSNYLPYNIGNIFKDYGYNTYAFHGWAYNFYNRDVTHTNLGFNYYGYDPYNKGYKNALKGITYSWPTSDIEVVNSSYDIFSSDDHFVAYYMSISGHLEYNFGGNAMASKNKNAVSDMDASTSIKAYMATQIEFDKSMEILLNDLEEDGLLEDTVIVIAPDHYPYGLTNDEIAEYVTWMNDENFDLYRNNLIIYNPNVETTLVEKNVSSIDILPTLLNMFGIEYDSRLLMGTDVFSDSTDLVIFNNKSWITDKGKYDYLKKVFYPTTTEEVSEEYINDINNIVNLKFQMSKLMISKDYYRKVLGE